MPLKTGVSNETLVEMIRTGSQGDKRDLYAQLYQQNYPIIYDICKRFSGGRAEDLADYLQEAFFAVMIAVKKYDDTRGSFITCLTVWIRSVLNRYIDNCGRTVRIPVHFASQIKRYNKIVQQFKLEKGREPSDEELKLALDIDDEQIDQLKKQTACIYSTSLDKPISEEDATLTFCSILPDPVDRIDEATEEIDRDRLKVELWEEVDRLNETQAGIIRRRYVNGESLNAISKDMAITRDAVTRMERTALDRLRRSERILRHREDFISSIAYHGTGINSFRNNGTSATEQAALKLYERDAKRKIRRIEQKHKVSYEEAYTLYILEKYKDILAE